MYAYILSIYIATHLTLTTLDSKYKLKNEENRNK